MLKNGRRKKVDFRIKKSDARFCRSDNLLNFFDKLASKALFK